MENKVLKNFSLLTISNLINQFILVFSGIKIARTLGPASYGAYTYMFIELMIYSTISDLGLRNIVIRTIARNFEKARSTFFSAVSLQLSGLLLCSLLMIIYEHFTHSFNPTLIIFLILSVFLMNLWGTCEAVWQGHQRMGVPAFINVFYSVVWIAFILLSPSSSFTVEYLFKYYCYSQVLQVGTLFICMFFAKGILTGKVNNIVADARLILKDSSHYYLNNVVTLPTSYLSGNFLERNSTKLELGYFSTSSRLLNPVKMVINLGLSAVFPNLSALWAKSNDELLKKVTTGFPIFAVIFAWLCYSFALISKEVVLILFGHKFLPSVPIIQFQVWFVFIFALNCFIGTVWSATDNQKLLGRCGIVNSLVATPFLWFGSKHGGIGLAYSYLVAYAFFFPFLYYFFKRSLKLELNAVKEFFLIAIMFLISSFIPIDASIFIRILLILIALIIIWCTYYKLIKSNFS